MWRLMYWVGCVVVFTMAGCAQKAAPPAAVAMQPPPRVEPSPAPALPPAERPAATVQRPAPLPELPEWITRLQPDPPRTTTRPAPATLPAPPPRPRAKIAVDLSTELTLITSIQKAAAAGDRDAILECIDPDARETMTKLLDMDQQLRALQKPLLDAMADQFAAEDAQKLSRANLFARAWPGPLVPLIRLTRPVESRVSQIVVEANGGYVRFENGQTWKIAMTNGQWHVKVAVPKDIDSEMTATRDDFAVFAKVYRDLARGITDGVIYPGNFDAKVTSLLGKYGSQQQGIRD